MPATERVLLVADRDADAPQLLTALRRLTPHPARVTLLVPAFAAARASAARVEVAWGAAVDRAERCAARLRLAGVELEEAIVGDPDPLAAAEDAHHARGFDRLVFATPNAGQGAFVNQR